MNALLPSLARLRLADTGGASLSRALHSEDYEEPPPPPPLSAAATPGRERPPRSRDADDASEARPLRPSWLPETYRLQRSDPATQAPPEPKKPRLGTKEEEEEEDDDDGDDDDGVDGDLPDAPPRRAPPEPKKPRLGTKEEKEEDDDGDDGDDDGVDGDLPDAPPRRPSTPRQVRPSRSRKIAASILDSNARYRVDVYPLQTLARDHPTLVEEAKRFVDEEISVTYGLAGPDGGLSKAFNVGLNQPHGWLVLATSTDYYEKEITVQTDVGSKVTRVAVPAGSTVGAILVSASNREWGTETTRALRIGNLVTLAVHQFYTGNYVHEALWQRLLQAIKRSGDTNSGRFSLRVQGGPCLNNDQTRSIYTTWGFSGVHTDSKGTTISGWSLTFTDGVPPALPGEGGEPVEELVVDVRVRSPLRDRNRKRE